MSQDSYQVTQLVRLTSDQIAAIHNPVGGRIVFNTTLGKAQVYSGSAWVDAAGGGLTGTLTTGKLPVAGTTPGTLIDSDFSDPGGTGVTAALTAMASINYVLPGFLVGSSDSATVALAPETGYAVLEINSFGSPLEWPYIQFNSAEGTKTAPTATKATDALGVIVMQGYGATGWNPLGATIEVDAAEDFTDTKGAAALYITTTDTVSETNAKRLLIDGKGNLIGNNGHLGWADTAPVVASDGTGTTTLDATASDTAGTVTEGTGVTTTTVTFNAAYDSVPHVLLTPWAGLGAGLALSAVTTGHFVITHASSTGGKFNYHVIQ